MKQVVGMEFINKVMRYYICSEGIKEKIKEIKPSLPEGTSLEVSFDRSNYIKSAINEVYKLYSLHWFWLQ